MVRVPAYISTIISAAADEAPDEIRCFPAGLQYLRMYKISQKSNFSKKECFVCTQKNRLNETLVFFFFKFKTHIFVRFGPSVKLEENNKF